MDFTPVHVRDIPIDLLVNDTIIIKAFLVLNPNIIANDARKLITSVPPGHPNPRCTCALHSGILSVYSNVTCSYIQVFSITGASLTTPDPSPDEPLSPATTGFIIVISLVVVIVVVFLVIKTVILRRKMEFFRRKDDEPLNSIILADGSRGSHPRGSRNEYTHIPTGNPGPDGKATGALQISTMYWHNK